PQGKTPRSLYQAEKRGEPTKYTLMRDALDRAMAVSHAQGDLSRMLKLYGYRLSAPENRKYVTICAINGGKPTRLYQLGEDYSLERMQVRIRQNSYTVQIEQPRYQKITTLPQKMRCRGSLLRCRKITGFQALYVHYLFLLGIVPKGRHKPLSPALREDLRRLDRYVAQHRFLCREGLNTVEEVTDFAQNKRVALADKCGQREHCYNRLRRCTVPEEVDSFKAQRDALTAEIAVLRRQIRLAEAVLTCTPKLRETIREEQRLQAQMRDEWGRAYREKPQKRKVASRERER
ncbi:MAG: hypothetical protein RRY95_08590, partial [Oscillospiraceae bacterium]